LFFGIAGLCALFGVIHSPLPGSPLVWPWAVPAMPEFAVSQTPVRIALAYALLALVLLLWGRWSQAAEPADATRAPGTT
jgi:AGZA family xanthine/uracil permease-like MFS transporter